MPGILKSKVNLRRPVPTFERPLSATIQVKTEMIVKKEHQINSDHEEYQSTNTNCPSPNTPHHSHSHGAFSPSSQASKQGLKEGLKDSKNIIKNYGKALCAFAASKTALPYLREFMERKGYDRVDLNQFQQYMKLKKDNTNSMESLRKLLIAEAGDSSSMRTYKALFKDIAVTFLKYFAVNWIYSGKLVQKQVHLKFRFKMLRRIQHPEFFTYLKTVIRP